MRLRCPWIKYNQILVQIESGESKASNFVHLPNLLVFEVISLYTGLYYLKIKKKFFSFSSHHHFFLHWNALCDPYVIGAVIAEVVSEWPILWGPANFSFGGLYWLLQVWKGKPMCPSFPASWFLVDMSTLFFLLQCICFFKNMDKMVQKAIVFMTLSNFLPFFFLQRRKIPFSLNYKSQWTSSYRKSFPLLC